MIARRILLLCTLLTKAREHFYKTHRALFHQTTCLLHQADHYAETWYRTSSARQHSRTGVDIDSAATAETASLSGHGQWCGNQRFAAAHNAITSLRLQQYRKTQILSQNRIRTSRRQYGAGSSAVQPDLEKIDRVARLCITRLTVKIAA